MLLTGNLKTNVNKCIARAYLFLILENVQLELLLFQYCKIFILEFYIFFFPEFDLYFVRFCATGRRRFKKNYLLTINSFDTLNYNKSKKNNNKK